MKRNLIIALLSIFSLAGYAQQAKHVVLITIDGFRPDFYLDPAWHTPHLRELMKNGVYAKGVNSVFPTMTYPSHTTIMTGVQPAKHGVYYNGLFEPTGSTGKIYWNDSSIHATTIWQVLHDKGLKLASLYWPVSAEAPVDYNIPDLGDKGDAMVEKYSKPAGFMEELKRELFNGAATINDSKDQNEAKIAAYIIKKDPPTLLNIHFFSVDHFEHMQGRSGDLVRGAVSDADESVGMIVDALKEKGIWDSTVIIITGDHGFLDVKTQLNPNVWLKNAGLITDLKKDDWKAQFNSSGGATYLYLKDPNDQATLKEVRKILKSQPDSIQRLFRLIDRKKLDEIGGNPEVALALSGENGAAFGGASTGELIRPGKGGTHGYFPDFQEIRTGFITCGPGIRAGGVISLMNLRDIAPFIARVLGFDFPSADGKVPKGL